MSSQFGIKVDEAIKRAARSGVEVHVEHNVHLQNIHLFAIKNKGSSNELSTTKVVTDTDYRMSHDGQEMLSDLINKMTEEIFYYNGGSEVEQLREELKKYKAAVKQLAFELEMASDGDGKQRKNLLLKESEVRKYALEQAADLLMDNGIVTTGADLEQICKKILELKPSKSYVMGQAAAQMENFFYGSKP